MTLNSLCGSGLAKANPRFVPEVSHLRRKSLCLGGQHRFAIPQIGRQEYEVSTSSFCERLFAVVPERLCNFLPAERVHRWIFRDTTCSRCLPSEFSREWLYII